MGGENRTTRSDWKRSKKYLSPVNLGKARRALIPVHFTGEISVLESAFDAYPERFVRGIPNALALPEAVWINRPKIEVQAQEMLH